MFGITLRTSSDAQAFWRLAQMASTLEPRPSVNALGYAPHLTLMRYDEVSPGALVEAAETLREEPAFSLTFDRIDFFDVDPIALWLSPRSDERLLDLHSQLNETMDPLLCEQPLSSAAMEAPPDPSDGG